MNELTAARGRSGAAKQLGLYVAILQTLNLFKLSFTRKKQPQDDERLVQLFKNRAGLKKAHLALEDEVYALKERVKQQLASTSRVQEKLEGVEALLGNPDAGHAALVYYQLRGLWRACNSQLATFASELERQQEDRERRKQAFEFNQQLNARVAEIAHPRPRPARRERHSRCRGRKVRAGNPSAGQCRSARPRRRPRRSRPA